MVEVLETNDEWKKDEANTNASSIVFLPPIESAYPAWTRSERPRIFGGISVVDPTELLRRLFSSSFDNSCAIPSLWSSATSVGFLILS